jgi:hypothetical protein
VSLALAGGALLSQEPTVESDEIGKYLLLPAAIGGVVGGVVGWAYGVTRRADVGRFTSLVAWVLFSGAAAVLVPVALIFVYGWATGIGASGFPLHGDGPRVTPFGIQAAVNSLGHLFLIVVFFGIPAHIIGSIIGAIIAFAKWGNRKAQAEKTTIERNEPGQV